MPIDRIAFGQLVESMRRQMGMRQADLGYELGVSDKAVSKWERGAALPSMESLERLEQVFGVPVPLLLDAASYTRQESSAMPAESPTGREVSGAQGDALSRSLAHLGIAPAMGTRAIYLVKRPNERTLRSLCDAPVEVVRTYLTPTPDGMRFVMQMRYGDAALFFSCKEDAHEAGRPIARTHGEELLAYANPDFAPLRSTLWAWRSRAQLIRVETYPFLPYTAIMTIESEEGEDPQIPERVTVVRDIADERAFTPLALARALAQGRL